MLEAQVAERVAAQEAAAEEAARERAHVDAIVAQIDEEDRRDRERRK